VVPKVPKVSKKFLNKTVCVVGLGYVGLPLAEAFSEHLRTIGYRRDQKKVDELNAMPGNTIEATTDPKKIKEADFVIIAVPTPVTRAKDPDPGPVIQAHRQFRQMPAEKIRSLINDTPLLIDVRGMIDRTMVEKAGIYYRKL